MKDAARLALDFPDVPSFHTVVPHERKDFGLGGVSSIHQRKFSMSRSSKSRASSSQAAVVSIVTLTKPRIVRLRSED